MSNTICKIIRMLQEACLEVGIESVLVESYSWQLLETITKRSRTQLLSHNTLLLSQDQMTWLDQAIHRLSMHEPLQYIIGTVQFLNCTIKVKSPVLIPRSETEEWVSQLIAYYNKGHVVPHTILDIGTGTGCIALMLAQAFPQAFVLGVDTNAHALELSWKNAHFNKIINVNFIQSDVYQNVPIEQRFDVIVSNPPYVSQVDWSKLDSAVIEWEDKNALVAEDDGLAVIKDVISGAITHLAAQGTLWIEIDVHQGAIVKELFGYAGFHNVHLIQDMQGRDRVVWGQRV